MTQYLLDTDIASFIIKGGYPRVSMMFARNMSQVAISYITAGELRYGAVSAGSKKLLAKVLDFCDLVPCIYWGDAAVQAYAELRTYLKQNELPVDAMDMLIAAAALAEGLTLVTNNIAHFSRIPNLKLENWLE